MSETRKAKSRKREEARIEVMSEKEAAKMLRVSVNTMRKYREDG